MVEVGELPTDPYPVVEPQTVTPGGRPERLLMNTTPSTTSFFDFFTNAEIARIAASGTRITMPAMWAPISESTPADKAYIVLEGGLSVRRHGEEIARLGPGDIVGEMALLNNRLRSASIVTLTPVVALHFTDDAIRELVAEVPAFAHALELVNDDRTSVA